MIRIAAASTHTELARTPNGSNTQPCSEVQERCVVAVFLSSSAVRVLSLSSFLSLPHSLVLSLLLPILSVFVCTSHSEVRTYSNKLCCCTAVYHTKYRYIIPSIIQQYHTQTVVDRASQMVDCCIIPVLSMFVCDSSCSNAFPFVLCRYHCRYHRFNYVGRVATVHIPSMPVRLYHCQYVGRVNRFC